MFVRDVWQEEMHKVRRAAQEQWDYLDRQRNDEVSREGEREGGGGGGGMGEGEGEVEGKGLEEGGEKSWTCVTMRSRPPLPSLSLLPPLPLPLPPRPPLFHSYSQCLRSLGKLQSLLVLADGAIQLLASSRTSSHE